MTSSSFLKLKNLCIPLIDPSIPLHSRIHKMQKEDLYVKRDDELSFSISGSKLRKYASLLPFLKKSKKKIAITGSAYSNHTLSIIQLLKQNGISYQLFLEKPKTKESKGNLFFLSLLTSEEKIIWLDKVDDPIPSSLKEHFEKELGESFLWIPLGGSMKESLPGALTLPIDIIEKEKEAFSHIFIDAGTGLTAIALILGLHYLQKPTKIHVVLIAGNESDFTSKLSYFHTHLEDLLQEKISLPTNYTLLKPLSAKSFGSSNASIFRKIAQTAALEGFFLDPIYTAKLFIRVVDERRNLQGKVLWVHSGGALSLTGFQNTFKINLSINIRGENLLPHQKPLTKP